MASEALTRAHHNDSERTKILKEVLRSAQKVQRFEKQSQPTRSKKQAGPAPSSPSLARSRGNAGGGRRESVDLDELLAAEREKGGVLEEHAQSSGLSPVLMGCGERISNLCRQVTLAEAAVSRSAAATKAISFAVAPDGIRFAPPVPEQEAINAERHRADRATLDYLTEHCRWAPLENLQEKIVSTNDVYEELREVFPRRRVNALDANLIRLNDKVLRDPEAFREALPADLEQPCLPQRRLSVEATEGWRTVGGNALEDKRRSMALRRTTSVGAISASSGLR